MPAANKRFGVSRGVCSRKVLREFESLSPVRKCKLYLRLKTITTLAINNRFGI